MKCAPCTCSPEREADCSPTSSSATNPSAPSSGMHIDVPSSDSAAPMDGFQVCTYGRATSAPLLVTDGAEKWISSMRAFLARVGQLPAEDLASRQITGRRWLESHTKCDQDSCFSNLSPASSASTSDSRMISLPSDTRSSRRSSPMLPLWVRHILGADIGLLHTPTRKANQCAPSMMKWPSCRRLKIAARGKLTPHLLRVDDGMANRVDRWRLEASGDGQVPLQAAVAWTILTGSFALGAIE